MTPYEEWVTTWLVESDLTRYSFEVRRTEGADPHDVSIAVFGLADAYLLGGCLKLATVLGEINGMEHVVTFRSVDGDLLHAVTACSPQADGEPLRGDCVDILGRRKLAEIREGMERTFGPVRTEVGERMPESEFEDGEKGRIRTLASVLPWTRHLSRSADAALPGFLEAARAATGPVAFPTP